MDRYDVINTLNELIEVSIDGEQGFRACAENVRNPTLETYFTEKAERCREGAEQLQQIVREMGDEPTSEASLSGAVHRFWVNIRGTISGMSDHAILDECERGEEYAERVYREALRRELPGDVRRLVDRQYAEVKANRARVAELRSLTA